MLPSIRSRLRGLAPRRIDMTDKVLAECVVRVVEANKHDEALLDCLWRVMEGDDEGVGRDEVVTRALVASELLDTD
jgi:hypothetical protein